MMMNATDYPGFHGNLSVIVYDDIGYETFVSDTIAFWFQVLVYVLMSGCVSLIGVLTNTVNIIIFARQGIFTDNGNATLLGLAVADLCCVISLLWLSISMSLVWIDPPNLSWSPWDIMFVTGGWPNLMFAQTTRMVTAYLAFERCVCVVFPFKVKSLFTPWRSIAVIAGIFACCALSYSPVFITHQLKHRIVPETNSTRLVLVSMHNWRLVIPIMLYINSFIFNIGAVVIVFACTMITVSRVKLSKVWRESLGTSRPGTSDTSRPIQGDNNPSQLNDETKKDDIYPKQEVKVQKMSSSKMQKEKKLVRMITSISVIMLVCYVPDLSYLIMFRVNPEIRMLGKYQNLTMVMYSLTFLFETLNSSLNIIVYYKMSSRYKKDFNLLLARTKDNDK